MSKINDLIWKICPNGVEYKKLNEIGNTFTGLSSKSKNDFINGNARFITYTNIYNNPAVKLDLDDMVIIKDNENQNELRYGDILVAGSSENLEDSGMISVVCEEPTENVYLNSFCFGFRLNDKYKDKLIPEFSKHIFRSASFRSQIVSCSFGVTRYNLNKKMFLDLTIPVPPIQIQEEIVRILDKFGGLEAELEAELEARKSQYEFWREKIFRIDECEWKTTEELFATITDYVANGSFKSIAENVSYKNEKDYAVLLRTVDFSNGYDVNKFIYIDEHAYEFLAKSKLFGGEIIINNIGAGVGTTFLCPNLGTPMSLAPNTIMMRTPNNKFYYYWFNSKRGQESIESVTTKSAMPKFNKTGFRKLLVPVPPIEVQIKIINILDKFDKLVNDITVGIPAEIKLRRQQYEYYRNKLLNFKELINV